MRRLPAIVPLILFIAVFPFVASAQTEPSWEIQALNQIIPGTPEGGFFYDLASGLAHGTNGIYIKYGDEPSRRTARR